MKLSEQLHQIHVSGDVGNYLDGFAEQAEALENAKPKIKMTKELPSECGKCYWCRYGDNSDIEIVYVVESPFKSPSNLFSIVRHHGLLRCDIVGGYYAKVDKSMFEFEGGVDHA